MKDSSEDMKLLAKRLFINHVSNSIESDLDYQPILKTICSKAGENFEKETIRRRFVLLLGAGASKSVNESILTANEASRKIEGIFNKTYSRAFPELFEAKIDQLSHVYNLDSRAFETRMLAIHQLFPENIRGELKTLFDKRYEVSLFNELVAHLLKHRFIDAIVNYNFDELLDNVLMEEVKQGDFKAIFADGHCPKDYEDELLYENQGGLKKPIYIKPHGTISHMNSLRFTREQYYGISEEIRGLLHKLFTGEFEDEGHKYELNLIIVGFGMNSFELNRIISETQKNRIVNTYIFDSTPEEVYLENMEKQFSRFSEEVLFESKFFQCASQPVTNNSSSIDTYFLELWQKTSKLHKKEFAPKGVERHELVSLIFSNKNKLLNGYARKKNRYASYFEARLKLEVILSFVESDGLINDVIIKNNRIAKYYKLYRGESSGMKSLSKIFKEIGLTKYKGFINDVYTVNQISLLNNETELIRFLHKNLVSGLNDAEVKRKAVANDNEINRLLISLKRNNRLNVQFDENIKYVLGFNDLKNTNLIRTDLHWSYSFAQAIKTVNNWDLALCISEKGRFLDNEINQVYMKDKAMEVIVASLDMENNDSDLSLVNIPTNIRLLSEKILYLPWWQHNQHMVLLLELKDEDATSFDDKFEPKAGFYYQSRLLQRNVNPVIMKDSDDNGNLKLLANIFATYWHNAKSYTKKGLPISSGLDDEKQLKTTKNDIAALY